MPCNSFRSSLLQLLGLQNPNSADLLGLDKQDRPCSTSAGNSENWKLNFYRPDKKQGGGSFQHCFFCGAQRTTCADVLSFGGGSDWFLQGGGGCSAGQQVHSRFGVMVMVISIYLI